MGFGVPEGEAEAGNAMYVLRKMVLGGMKRRLTSRLAHC